MKYLALSVLLLCSMSLSLSAAVSGGVKARLYSLAETKGYGYKTANLTLLQEELPRLNKQLAKSTRYTVAVPAFVGISSEEIHSFLLHYVGINLQELWKKLPTDSADWIADALASKKMPEEVMLTIDKIAEFIDIKCNEFIAQNKLICKKLFPSTVKLIDHIKGKKETACMVRSTGREDTQELANAGGNKSVVNVPINNTKAILHAIKEVLLSYMSAKSLNQRLCDGDATVADVPFLPILVQRMIGEKDESAFIPRCGVMFTEEAEGHVSKDFRSGITIIQAAYGHNELVVNSLGPVDTYFIDADAQKYSVIRHKQARLKPQLQAGLIEITNEAPYAPPQGAVLDQNAVLALKMVANELEAIYGIPMDVEFTLVEEAGKKVVYILQARPINHKKNENAPAYLDLNNPDVQTMPQMKCQVVGAGGGSLRCINALKLWKGAGASPIKAFDQVIAAPTISMAYAAYDACLDKDKINLIIIGTMAPSTSHEATFFRGLRKPVIAVSDFERIKKWLKEPEYALVIDAQQQLIVQLNNDFKSRVSSHLSAFRASAAGLVSPLPVLEEHTSPVDFGDSILAGESQFGPDDIYSGAGVGAGYKTPTKRPSPLRSTSSAGAGRSEDSPLGLKSPVTDIGILRQDFLVDQGLARVGWISYPLPKELSLNVQKSLPIKILSLDKLVFFNDDHKKRAHTQLAIAIKSKNFTSYIKQQILLAKTAEELQAKEALSNLWQLFFVTPKKVKIDQTRYNQILMQAAALVQSILNGIKVPQSDPAYLSKRLFPIHWLETLIFQQHKDDDLLYADSLVSLWADGGIVKKSSADLVDEPVLPAGSKVTAEHLEALNMLRQHALTDEIALKWTSFIKTLTSCVNDASDPDAAGPAGGGAGAGGSDKPVDRGGEVKEFFENIKRLGSLNALPLWLNTSFAEKERPSLTLFNREITEAGDFLTALEEYKNKLSSVSLNGFSDPSTFFKHWHNFQQNIVNYFLDDTENGFKSSFCEANALGKRVAITLMERLIDTFDTVIKSVTGSILFEVIDDLPRRQTHAKILKNSLLSVAQVQKHKDKIFTYYFMLHL